MISPGSLLIVWLLLAGVVWLSPAVCGLVATPSRRDNRRASHRDSLQFNRHASPRASLLDSPPSSRLLLELPSWGVVSVKGDHRLRLLHGIASQSFESANVGGAFSTCFLDATGRVLHYARALVTESDVKLVCEADAAPVLCAFIDRVIFPADKASVVDESAWSRVCLMVGPDTLQESLPIKCADFPAGTDLHSDRQPAFQSINLGIGVQALVVPGNDLTAPGAPAELGGHTVLLQQSSPDSNSNSKTKPAVAFSPTVPTGDVSDWHRLRTQTGRFSLAEARALNATALELGLMHALHFQKGCYAGQEAVSKAVAMRSVRRRLVGLQSQGGELEVGDGLLDSEGEACGTVSSSCEGGAGLGLLKARLFDGAFPVEAATHPPPQQGQGLRLGVAGKPHLAVTARALPFARFGTASSVAPPLDRLQSVGQNIIVPAAGAGAGAGAGSEGEEARKAAKLEEMAKKVAALRARKPAP